MLKFHLFWELDATQANPFHFQAEKISISLGGIESSCTIIQSKVAANDFMLFYL